MIVAMKAPAQAARTANPATGALLLRMADQDLISRGQEAGRNRLEGHGWYRALCPAKRTLILARRLAVSYPKRTQFAEPLASIVTSWSDGSRNRMFFPSAMLAGLGQ